ncbi:hypothetical protein BT69DRAFT_1336589 [Atractiella rhizophila]|nr:hypothetical protein BT69DRAFT_1336589 [Atractiella rhizophila]
MDFELRHPNQTPTQQRGAHGTPTPTPMAPSTRGRREISLQELNNALTKLIDNNRFLERSDIVGLRNFARSYIAIQLTSIHTTQVALQRQFADLVDKFVISREPLKVIEECNAIIAAVQHLLRDHRVISYKDGFNGHICSLYAGLGTKRHNVS